MLELYGISNCDTVKKAKSWLEKNNKDYQFHDYRKQGLSAELLNLFEAELGWETLLNKRSTSWRQLNEEIKNNISKETALQAMMETPTLIKRPILKIETHYIIGFNAENYQQQL
jgi:Spx/MgsR family transcriptional regulator